MLTHALQCRHHHPEVNVVIQQGQVFELTRTSRGAEPLWPYRYRIGGRGSRRVQRGGFVYRFEATQALRQVLHRAVAWGMIDVNPAKVGVDNPTRRRKEQRPFESWAELEALAEAIGPRYGAMILFAAATGIRPAEWIALEKRDIDREGSVAYIRRSFTKGVLKVPKTEASLRAVPLQARALDALDQQPPSNGSPLLFPGERGGYLDIHHFRPFQWRPAQLAVGIDPLRRIYDLRHTFATFALRAGISTFDLSRYMGASLTMIDRQYGHPARACDPPARRAERRATSTV